MALLHLPHGEKFTRYKMKCALLIPLLVVSLFGVSQGGRIIGHVKIMKSDFKSLQLCLIALPKAVDDLVKNESSIGKNIPPIIAKEDIERKIAETKDINNYTCSISEDMHNAYSVIISLAYGGISSISESSQWYDATTFEFLGWHMQNPRESDQMVFTHLKFKEMYISAEFLDQCGVLINKMELDLKKRYLADKRISDKLSDVSNYNVVIVENNATYDVLLLEKKIGFPFDSTNNVLYRVNRKGCKVIEKIQTKIYGIDDK